VYGHDVEGVTVAHNLLYANSNYGAYLSYAVPRSNPKIVGCRHNRVVNNLIIGNRAGAVGLPHDWELAEDNRSDANLYIGQGQYMDGRKVQPPLFVVNSAAHSAPEQIDGQPAMTPERQLDEILQIMRSAGLPEEQLPQRWFYLQHPLLTLDQWRAATGNDGASVVDSVYVQHYEYFAGLQEWQHEFSDAIERVVCEPLPGVDHDYYGLPLGPSPRPGPFQSIRPGPNRFVVWPVKGIKTSQGFPATHEFLGQSADWLLP
jgi:hypothetical protein